MPKIIGNIVRILDRRTIIINLGKNKGVTESTVFSIYSKSEKIIDPQTNEELGQVILVKAKVKATQVFEKFTIASSKWKELKYPTITSGSLTGLDFMLSEVGESELRVNPDDIEPWKAITEEPIKLGDAVEALVQDSPNQEEDDNIKPDEQSQDGNTDNTAQGDDHTTNDT